MTREAMTDRFMEVMEDHGWYAATKEFYNTITRSMGLGTPFTVPDEVAGAFDGGGDHGD